MKKAALFIIDGFEEVEAVGASDILRRGGVDVKIVSLSQSHEVKSKHNITIKADALFDEIQKEHFDMLVIPGGTTKYLEHEGLLNIVTKFNNEGKPLGAICAAPAVFGKLGLLKGRKATIYPGMQDYLGEGAIFTEDSVVTDGNITTSRGPSTVFVFALRLLEILLGQATAAQIKKDILAD